MKLLITMICISAALAPAGLWSMDGTKEEHLSLSLEQKLALLKTTDLNNIFIRALPMHKKESRLAIIERLGTLPDAITIDKHGVITLEGPLVEAFAYNADKDAPNTTLDKFVVESDLSIKG